MLTIIKYDYAAWILSVLAIGLAKASVVMLYRRIDIYQSGRGWFLGIMSLVITWTVFGLFAFAFRCHGPHFWVDTEASCPASSGLLIAVLVTNIVTDVFLVLFVIPGIWKLTMRKTMRVAVIALFSCRFLYEIHPLISVSKTNWLQCGRSSHYNSGSESLAECH
jgi:hypothetical protein